MGKNKAGKQKQQLEEVPEEDEEEEYYDYSAEEDEDYGGMADMLGGEQHWPNSAVAGQHDQWGAQPMQQQQHVGSSQWGNNQWGGKIPTPAQMAAQHAGAAAANKGGMKNNPQQKGGEKKGGGKGGAPAQQAWETWGMDSRPQAAAEAWGGSNTGGWGGGNEWGTGGGWGTGATDAHEWGPPAPEKQSKHGQSHWTNWGEEAKRLPKVTSVPQGSVGMDGRPDLTAHQRSEILQALLNHNHPLQGNDVRANYEKQQKSGQWDAWGGGGGGQQKKKGGGQDAWAGQQNGGGEWDSWGGQNGGQWDTWGGAENGGHWGEQPKAGEQQKGGKKNKLNKQENQQGNKQDNNKQKNKKNQQQQNPQKQKKQQQHDPWGGDGGGGWGDGGGWDTGGGGWGMQENEEDYSDDDDMGRRVHFTPITSNLWGGSEHDSTYKMPSKTLAHAYNGTTTSLFTGTPRNKVSEDADVQFVDSRGAALIPVQQALFGKSRMAKDRIHWMFPPNKDERVSSLLAWIELMSYSLGAYGLHRFLQSRERGALFANADYRPQNKPNEPAFDWLTFDQLQVTRDRVLQESVAFYDPAATAVVFVFLPSKSGNSVAMWRRRISIPNNTRTIRINEIRLAMAGLRREKDYVVHVDEWALSTSD
ncbi:hypothetical protein R3P38DRAFT_2829714 [Favolaschia claudopus]|uniref:CcmS related domain-containing protein n=1 Tax=Favolaschia claudopus TaxID=2862362 RepID=A0AAW0EAZ3_9AGAR